MEKSYPAIAGDLGGAIQTLKKAMPDLMQAFHQLGSVASKDSVLDEKTKELLAIAIAIAARCDGCIAFHVKAGIKYGMSRDELCETIAMAVYMGGGPSMIYGAQTLEAFDQFSAT